MGKADRQSDLGLQIRQGESFSSALGVVVENDEADWPDIMIRHMREHGDADAVASAMSSRSCSCLLCSLVGEEKPVVYFPACARRQT